MILLAVLAATLAFTVSSSAGLGGSLILVPALSLLLSPREGIAVAAILLSLNNVGKLVAYRRTIPWKASGEILLFTVIGASLGASLLLRIPESWVHSAIITSIAWVLVVERHERRTQGFSIEAVPTTRVPASLLALAAGTTSGISGTSGPLKGVALRCLRLDRMHLVGAASVVSLGGDLTKAAILTGGSLLGPDSWVIILASAPLIPFAVALGHGMNRRLGERAYSGLFWGVMTAYVLRLAWV